MELGGILSSLPIIGTIVGLASGTISVVLHGVRGYRHLRQRLVKKPVPPRVAAPPESPIPTNHQSGQVPSIRTPDQRLRVFVSSTLQELSGERIAARQAITRLRLSPVLFEIGARPHPPRELYRAYLAQSDVFVGIYWEKYGWVAPGEDVSGLEDEYRLAQNKPKLIYIKTPAPGREHRLTELLDRIRADDHVSYKSFATARELRGLVADDLALLLTERFAFPRANTEIVTRTTIASSHVAGSHTPAPIQTTSFVGRESQLAEIRALVGQTRVTTLTGPGGVGKTRLALQVASEWENNYADGACVVDLAALVRPDLVPQAIADAVGVREEPGAGLLETLASALESRHVLLVLDNCEQVVGGCARAIDHLIRTCPGVDVLATSREPFRVGGETTLVVPPMRVVDARDMLSTEAIRECEAVRLFVDRARAAQPGFAVTAENASAVADVCTRLDGIPLAIELAAARVKALTPVEIAERLDNRFRLLNSGTRTALPRQQTLRALVDWSYDLLSTAERTVFRRLAVFAGGWTLDAAEAITSAPEEELDVLELLTALVDKSLVLTSEQLPGHTRYRLLETLREYAKERLTESGERDACSQQHAAYYLGVFEQAEPRLIGPDQVRCLEELKVEHDNVRTALQWAAETGQTETGLRIASAASRFWSTRYIAEGADWLRVFLSNSDTVPVEVRARALNLAGVLATATGDLQRAVSLLERCVVLRRELGEARPLAVALNTLGGALLEMGNLAGARPVLNESLGLRRQSGDERSIAVGLSTLAELARRSGQLVRARRLGHEALELARRSGDKWVEATLLNNLGATAIREADYASAVSLLNEAVMLFQELGDRRVLAECLRRLAFVAGCEGRALTAARLLGASVALRSDASAAWLPEERSEYDRTTARARDGLGEQAFALAFGEGEAMSVTDALACARSTEGRDDQRLAQTARR